MSVRDETERNNLSHYHIPNKADFFVYIVKQRKQIFYLVFIVSYIACIPPAINPAEAHTSTNLRIK